MRRDSRCESAQVFLRCRCCFMCVHFGGREEIIIECVDDIDSLFEGDKLQGIFNFAPIKTVDRINQNENEKNANN